VKVTKVMVMAMVGVSWFPEQPTAAESDASREVPVCLLGERAGGSTAGCSGQTDAEGARSGRSQRSTDQLAN